MIITTERHHAKAIAEATMIEYGVPRSIAADAAMRVPIENGFGSIVDFVRPIIRQHSVYKAFRQPPPLEMDGLGLA